ncbi:hypothetical protein G6F43_005972 [Rhizopus delemar]|nr:hypothetical protein G6F43_005972 [Rhizopus delemar]
MLRNSLNGVFSVYKPKGLNSRKATDYVQLALSNELLGRTSSKLKRNELIKIGHGGTLDPLAEGVLVLGVGSGCKQLSNYLKCNKEYIVTAKLGQSTDTFDSEGKVINQGNIDHLTAGLVEETLRAFKGTISQTPPIYSALRMNGKRLYDYARDNIPLPKPIQPRTVLIEEIELVNFSGDMCSFRVQCGGGTYMRSLVHDMAISMGTFGHMTGLQRTRQGAFNLNNSLLLNEEEITVPNVESKIKQFEVI